MAGTIIQLPDCVIQLIARQTCRDCHAKLTPDQVYTAGVRRGDDGQIYLYYEMRCTCGDSCATLVKGRPLSGTHWAQQIADGTEVQWVPQEDPREPKVARHTLTERSPLSTLTLLLGTERHMAVNLFGGYTALDGSGVYLLYRWRKEDASVVDGLLRVETPRRIRMADLTYAHRLVATAWDSFLELPDDSEIKICGRSWRKMTRTEIELLVRDRIYKIAGTR